jgi:small-conductance mechanosensitive channel
MSPERATRRPQRVQSLKLEITVAWLVTTALLASPAAFPQTTAEPASPLPAPRPSPAAPASTGPTVKPAFAVEELSEAARPEEAFTLRYGNRPIVVFRARLLGRTPELRAATAVVRLDELAAQKLSRPVEAKIVGGVGVVTVAGRQALVVLPGDIDPVGGTLESTTAGAANNLSRAMAEVVAARSPALLLQGAVRAIAATVVAILLASLLWLLRERIARRGWAWLESRLVRRLDRGAPGAFWRMAEAGIVGTAHFLGRVLLLTVSFAVAYGWLGFVMRQFPYTRPWGEALRGFVLHTLASLGRGVLAALPGLFTVVIVVAAIRFIVRVVGLVFRGAEHGRIRLPGVHPETAEPTRRLAVALLWLFAVVVAYPYLPGSGTDAFKGVSVFVGLIISLGSSGLVNQAMSSFMITYSRALRIGDYVRIGDVEGTVVHSGLLATKLLTPKREEVTLPNAVVASSTITNYSRQADEGVYVRTSVTIGYDTPWRQVEALLLTAAARTAGVNAQPPPRVLQVALQDFYVEYALIVVPEQPAGRLLVLSDLHAHIQDAFNEHGVQIMSPHYRADPEAPKVVPKSDWFAPPARREPAGRGTTAGDFGSET